MELRIKPFPKNTYPKKGLLIKGSSPFTWLYEMEILGIDLHQVRSFPVPSNEPNGIYGCFLIFNGSAPDDIGRNAYFQCVDNKLFIPENTIFYPKVNPEDWQTTDAEFLIMHPDFGLVKLNEETDWLSLIQHPEQAPDTIRKPSNGVKIPQKIESYTVEMDDDKVLEALEKPKTEEEWMKDLPFDLKKVMAGNKKEIEKYLDYIEKYPDRAVDLGVPLDVMGTSRGDGFSQFKFGNPWLDKLLGGKENNSSRRNYTWMFWGILLALGLVRMFVHFNRSEPVKAPVVSSGEIYTEAGKEQDPNLMKPMVAYQSGVTDVDMKIDSIYGRKRRELMEESVTATLMYHNPKKETTYKEYLEKGGRPIEKIYEDIDVMKAKVKTSEDSLKKVYRKRITEYIGKNEAGYRQKIKDSIKKANPGKWVDNHTVKTILKKKQVLVEDSLGRLYGTKEYPDTPVYRNENSDIGEIEIKKPHRKQDISFSDIFWLIVAMTGAVGLYSFIIKRRSLNVGGDHVPAGIKIFLMIVLVVMLAYIFYPLIEMYGYNWFVWILIICVVLLLYRLFSEDKTILKSDKDE
ncbi:MAG: APC family permease [Chryseobacterium sp.]|jgi:hypothetical protein|uniref:APC family permease n=1 Tax=Chryseobacterium sp. TaxID=1871047 RepID=UPI0028187578|nr:APC family permease [Chryseobacterium sp.]MDR2238669.1 APC family permease [Chryseobacterium sp.]